MSYLHTSTPAAPHMKLQSQSQRRYNPWDRAVNAGGADGTSRMQVMQMAHGPLPHCCAQSHHGYNIVHKARYLGQRKKNEFYVLNKSRKHRRLVASLLTSSIDQAVGSDLRH